MGKAKESRGRRRDEGKRGTEVIGEEGKGDEREE